MRRLAAEEVERQMRIEGGDASPEDLITLHPHTWTGARAAIHREARRLRAEARAEFTRKMATPERIQAFVGIMDQGLDAKASNTQRRTVSNIFARFLLDDDDVSELLEALGVSSVAELESIVEAARSGDDMTDEQRADACERFLLQFYGKEGRARQRQGIRRLGGELPLREDESRAEVL